MNGRTHPIRRTLQSLLVAVVAAAIAGSTALAGNGPSANASDSFGRGCADFGLVFYIDGCVK